MEIKSTSYVTPQACPHRLPCGMCRLTMTQCSQGWMYKPAWDTTPVYCGSGKTADTSGIGVTIGKM